MPFMFITALLETAFFRICELSARHFTTLVIRWARKPIFLPCIMHLNLCYEIFSMEYVEDELRYKRAGGKRERGRGKVMGSRKVRGKRWNVEGGAGNGRGGDGWGG